MRDLWSGLVWPGLAWSDRGNDDRRSRRKQKSGTPACKTWLREAIGLKLLLGCRRCDGVTDGMRSTPCSLHTGPVSLFRRSAQRTVVPALPVEDVRPTQARLYTEYIAARSSSRRPVDSREWAMSRASFIDPLTETARNKLVVLIERHQPKVVLPGSRFRYAAHEMANVAIELMVGVRGDLSLRSTSSHPQLLPKPFDDLAGYILDGDCPLALDAVGAWIDSYARLPDTRWLREDEDAFVAAVADVFADSIFAIRGREIILREDLGASILIDKPLMALVTSNPALRAVDDKLREALAELADGNPADAVTDAGTALQMLLDQLGFTGGQLGDQLKAARKAGWLSGVDTPLAVAVESLGTWIASIRNQRSDAHHGPAPDARDAELAVRVVGLLVLRFG